MSALTTVTKTANTQTLRALVERLLPSLEWRHHGIGVLQGYVREDADPEIRVHIWSRDLAGETDNEFWAMGQGGAEP